MSRMAVALLFAAPAPPVTAEEALRVYRETFSAARPAACAEIDDPQAIVVCGRRDQDPRLPLPVEPEPGERVRLGPNDLPSGTDAMNAGACLRLCQGSVGVDLKMMKDIVDGIGRLLEGDD